MKLKINVKQVGRKKPEIGKYEMEVASQSYDLRGLITEIVTLSVDDYNRRVSDKSIKKLLSDDEMADMSEVGKIAFGINYGENKAVPGHAVETAVSGFRDGFFRVFLDDREIMSLDEAVEITHDSVLTFIRLVMLSGRLW